MQRQGWQRQSNATHSSQLTLHPGIMLASCQPELTLCPHSHSLTFTHQSHSHPSPPHALSNLQHSHSHTTTHHPVTLTSSLRLQLHSHLITITHHPLTLTYHSHTSHTLPSLSVTHEQVLLQLIDRVCQCHLGMVSQEVPQLLSLRQQAK